MEGEKNKDQMRQPALDDENLGEETLLGSMSAREDAEVSADVVMTPKIRKDVSSGQMGVHTDEQAPVSETLLPVPMHRDAESSAADADTASEQALLGGAQADVLRASVNDSPQALHSAVSESGLPEQLHVQISSDQKSTADEPASKTDAREMRIPGDSQQDVVSGSDKIVSQVQENELVSPEEVHVVATTREVHTANETVHETTSEGQKFRPVNLVPVPETVSSEETPVGSICEAVTQTSETHEMVLNAQTAEPASAREPEASKHDGGDQSHANVVSEDAQTRARQMPEVDETACETKLDVHVTVEDRRSTDRVLENSQMNADETEHAVLVEAGMPTGQEAEEQSPSGVSELSSECSVSQDSRSNATETKEQRMLAQSGRPVLATRVSSQAGPKSISSAQQRCNLPSGSTIPATRGVQQPVDRMSLQHSIPPAYDSPENGPLQCGPESAGSSVDQNARAPRPSTTGPTIPYHGPTLGPPETVTVRVIGGRAATSYVSNDYVPPSKHIPTAVESKPAPEINPFDLHIEEPLAADVYPDLQIPEMTRLKPTPTSSDEQQHVAAPTAPVTQTGPRIKPRPEVATPAAPLTDDEVLQHTASMWKYTPVPGDEPDPAPEYLEDRIEYPGSTVIAARVRGKKHKHEGTNCDDWYETGNYNDVTFLVVSDGAGSKKYSRIGAKASCEAAVAHLKTAFAQIPPEVRICLRQKPKDDPQVQSAYGWIAQAVQGAAQAAYEGVRTEYVRRADKPKYAHSVNRELDIRDFSGTLLIAVIVPVDAQRKEKVLVSYQVGDGLIAVVNTNVVSKDAARILLDPDGGEFAGETEFLTSDKMRQAAEMQKRTSLHRSEFDTVMVMSDGVADDYDHKHDGIRRLYCDLVANGILSSQRGLGVLPPEPQRMARMRDKLPAPLEFAWVNDQSVKVALHYTSRICEAIPDLTIDDLWSNPGLLDICASKYPDEAWDAMPAERRLRSWLDNYTQRGSFDDRTLVIATIDPKSPD